jgi:phospholipase C
MKRILSVSICLLVLLGGVVTDVAETGHRAVAQHTTSNPIQHIVFIMKENHTFDSYFGSFPGANGATTGEVKINGVANSIPLNAAQDVMANFNHRWANAKTDYDGGKMDAFNLGDPKLCGQPPYMCYQVGSQSLIPNYWSLAQHFVLDDHAWSSMRGASFPNHLYMMSAGSGSDIPHSAIYGPSTANSWGCDAPTTARAALLNGTTVFPCFTFSTLADEMQAAGVSWKYYAPGQGQSGYNWNAADYFNQLRNTSLWSNDVSDTQFAIDAANGALPAFSWLTPSHEVSEHNGFSDCKGENWTIQQINAVMNGPDWSSTVIVLAWDDFGGLYDHGPPQNIDPLGYGFRVPFMVISPYAYATDNSGNRHISHAQVEFSSVLRLAEEVFSLPSLGRRDTTAGDLMQLLDFSQMHNAPLPLSQRTCPASKISPPQIIDD